LTAHFETSGPFRAYPSILTPIYTHTHGSTRRLASPSPLAPRHSALVGHAVFVLRDRPLCRHILLLAAAHPGLCSIYPSPASAHCRRHRRASPRPVAILREAASSRP